MPLPLGGWSPAATGLTQVSGGRFSETDVGIANEMATMLLEGLLTIKGTLARVGSSAKDLDRWVALGHGRMLYTNSELRC